MQLVKHLVPLALLVLPGCDTAPDPAGPDASTGAPDAGASDGFVELIGADWEIPAGGEDYLCARVTVTEDMWIDGLRAVAPPGTHHTVLTVGAPDGPDGVTPCDTTTNLQVSLFGSGVGSHGVALPEGVAAPVRAGQQLLLNLHLFNASDQSLTGHSAVEVSLVEPDAALAEAAVVLAGKDTGLIVPVGSSTQTGHCTVPGDTELFAIFPHMHQLGRRMKVVLERASGEETVLDTDYVFDDQRWYELDTPAALGPGDRVRIECSYDNYLGRTVTFGESSDDEMCYAGLFHFPPAAASAVTCTR